MDLPLAPEWIAERGWKTYAVSVGSFVPFVTELRDEHILAYQAGAADDPDVIQRLLHRYGLLLVTCNSLSPSIQREKFPSDSEDIWPFYCFPVELVSNMVQVLPKTLLEKARRYDNRPQWPASSTPTVNQIALQFGAAEETSRVIFGADVATPFEGVVELCRNEFLNVYPEAEGLFSVYVDLEGIRYGPLVNQHHWNQVNQYLETFFKISMYATCV